MSRIKIDLQNGVLDIEGEEAFVKEIYNEYREKIYSRFDESALKGDRPVDQRSTKIVSKLVAKKQGKKGPRKESYTIIKDLDTKNLVDFYKEKGPQTGFERNVVFVYFLEKKIQISNITPNHIYTCLKHVEVEVPKALKQSLVDTYHSKGWIDASDMENITTTTAGENIVEHRLPRNTEKPTKK